MPKGDPKGHLYQPHLASGNATWYLKYYINGTAFRVSTGTDGADRAEKFRRDKIAEIIRGTVMVPKNERIKVSELADDLFRDYRIHNQTSREDVETRWERHLKPCFGHVRANKGVTSDHIERYIDRRQNQGASNATINRELAALRRMFRLGLKAKPPKVRADAIPPFPHLAEDNVRKGFVAEDKYQALYDAMPELCFKALLEVGATYGWRVGELLSMHVSQVDLLNRTLRLEPGTTKNRQGREVRMTQRVYELLAACITGKSAGDFVFTRADGSPVKDFRQIWWNACTAAGLGQLVETANAKGKKAQRWRGLLFHDLRRTAARNLRNQGEAEGVIMRIGGWKTRSVFDRYAIVSQADMDAAVRRLDEASTHRTAPKPTEPNTGGRGDVLPPPKSERENPDTSDVVPNAVPTNAADRSGYKKKQQLPLQ